MKRVPKLRFPEFTDDWEQRKLEDYLTVSAEKNTGNIYGRSDVLSVSGDYGIVNQIEFQGRSFAGASVSNYGVVQTGDVVYTKSPLNSNPYGIIKTNKGKPGIVSTLYAVYHPKENAFSDFIQVYFEQHARMNNYMHPLVNKGAKNDMKVSAENALKGPVYFPSRVEQESISAFFSVIDHIITLHQRKLEKLKELRKGVMQKLFSQEVRFKADDGSEFPEWEEKKLDDVAVRVTRKNKDNITDIPLTISSADGLIDQRDFFNKVVASKDMSGYYLLKKGEFAYNKSYSKGYDFGSIKKLDLYAEGALSTLYICFALNKDENPDFYQKYFDSLFWYLELQKICAEGARNHGLLNVSTNEFFQMKLKVPSSKQEQKKIADCLSSLDDVIEKQKVTLAAWEEMKKGLLQQMFV